MFPLGRGWRIVQCIFVLPARGNCQRTEVGNPVVSCLTHDVLNPISCSQNKQELKALDPLQNPTIIWAGMGWNWGRFAGAS